MTFDDLKPLTDWLQANPGLAGLATFVISIAESLAIIGLLIPGTLVMGAIGALIGAGILPGIEITLWAIAGAIIGDGMSYWLGYHYHGHIREMWPFRSYPSLLQKGESFFLKYGGMSVFMGRFIGPIRPIIPVVAGMMNMPPARFTLANIGSAITWAPAYMMPGILLGALSLQLAPQAGARFLLRAVIGLLLLWLLYWLLKIMIRLVARILDQQIAYVWLKMNQQSHLYALRKYLQDPIKPQSHAQFKLALSFLASLFLFVGIVIYVYCQGAATWLNTIAMMLMVSIRVDMIDSVMAATALLGSAWILFALFIVVLGVLLFNRYRRAAKYWFILGAVTTACVVFLQFFIPYSYIQLFPSPNLEWTFPSYSTALHTALLGYLAVLSAQRWPNYRVWIYTIIALLIFMISFAELYLSIHGLTAILSGILLGLTCIMGVTFWYRRRCVIPIPVGGILITGLLTLILIWVGMMYRAYPTVLERYAPLALPPIVLNATQWWATETLPQDLYRHDATGKSIELLNIQWMSSLKMIEMELRANGWHVVHKPDLATIINRIAAKNRFEQLPLFPHLYLHRKPALIMTKKVTNSERMLVLRLWDTNIEMDSPRLPLWLGTVDYHVPWKAPRLLKPKQLNSISSGLLPPVDVLVKSLTTFTWKAAPSSIAHCMEHLKVASECEGNILFIQPQTHR